MPQTLPQGSFRPDGACARALVGTKIKALISFFALAPAVLDLPRQTVHRSAAFGSHRTELRQQRTSENRRNCENDKSHTHGPAPLMPTISDHTTRTSIWTTPITPSAILF